MLLQVRQLERTVSLRDLSIVEIDEKMRELSAATYDGVFVWKISDFTKKRQDAVAGRAPAMFSPGNTFHMRNTCFVLGMALKSRFQPREIKIIGLHQFAVYLQHFIRVNTAIRCACGST